MKIQWPGCQPLKHVVWWAQRWQTSRRWSDGCAEGKIPATAVQPLRFWDWLPGRGSGAESSSLQGREKVAPGWGVSSMTGKGRAWGILRSGHCTGGNPGKCCTYISSHLETVSHPGLTRLVCGGMELRTELRHSSWASGIWIWISRFFFIPASGPPHAVQPQWLIDASPGTSFLVYK